MARVPNTPKGRLFSVFRDASERIFFRSRTDSSRVPARYMLLVKTDLTHKHRFLIFCSELNCCYDPAISSPFPSKGKCDRGRHNVFSSS